MNSLWRTTKSISTNSASIRAKLDSMSVKDRLAYWNERLKVIKRRKKQGFSCAREEARVLRRIDELQGKKKREVEETPKEPSEESIEEKPKKPARKNKKK